MKAPEFTLPDQNGKIHSLKDYHGRWLVIYFYPRDNTPGCTIEACSFRDNFELLTSRGVVVFGISKDSVKSHKKFADQFNMPFYLLSDESKDTIKAFGAWGKKKFMGREFEGIYRNTYIVDPEGIIRKMYEKVDPKTHLEQIMKDLEAIQAENTVLTTQK